MRAAAEILLIEGAALRPILDATPEEDFHRPTVCTGWSVRDVLAHCGAVLNHIAHGHVPGFAPADNQIDVDERAPWELQAVLHELWAGYDGAAVAIDAAGGSLDGVGIGEWMHGGDVREALGEPDAYVSPGVEMARDLLLERSRRLEGPSIEVWIDGTAHDFGVGAPGAQLETDLETFVRLCGGRRPNPERYALTGVAAADLVLFS